MNCLLIISSWLINKQIQQQYIHVYRQHLYSIIQFNLTHRASGNSAFFYIIKMVLCSCDTNALDAIYIQRNEFVFNE